MYKHPVLTKVPGDVAYGTEKGKQGYIQDINKLNKSELLDLLERQELLLRNKKQISKLPDKGRKVEDFYNKILRQLKFHENIDLAAEKFSELNIASVGKQSVMKMEWSEKLNAQRQAVMNNLEKINHPVKLEENYEVPRQHLDDKNKQYQVECNTTDDLLETDLGKTSNVNILVSKSSQSNSNKISLGDQSSNNCSSLEGKQFNWTSTKLIPTSTTKSIVHDIEREKWYKGHSGRWENTSATPPPLTHPPVKILSLKESVEVQEEKNNLIQQAKTQYQAERSLEREGKDVVQD